jgi:hypothetical protein
LRNNRKLSRRRWPRRLLREQELKLKERLKRLDSLRSERKRRERLPRKRDWLRRLRLRERPTSSPPIIN